MGYKSLSGCYRVSRGSRTRFLPTRRGNMDQQLGLTRERERAGRIGNAGLSRAGERLTYFFFSVSLGCRMQTNILRHQDLDSQLPLQVGNNRMTATSTAQNCSLIHETDKASEIIQGGGGPVNIIFSAGESYKPDPRARSYGLPES